MASLEVQQTRIAAIYSRVSTSEQAERTSLDVQESESLACAERAGYTVPPAYRLRDDYTGSELNRPALNTLFALAAQHAISAVFFHKIDRMARDLHVYVAMTHTLKGHGIPWFITTMGTVSVGDDTQLLMNIQAVFADYEKHKIVERMQRGKVETARLGYVAGGARPYGYRYVRGAHGYAEYAIDDAEAAIVRYIFQLCGDERLTLRQIVMRLRDEGITRPRYGNTGTSTLWRQSTILKMLHNPAYTGTAYYGRVQYVPRPNNPKVCARILKPQDEWMPVQTPPIISHELFAATQEQLVRNRQESRRNRKHPHLLIHGRLRCGDSSHAMSGYMRLYSGGRRKAAYKCAEDALVNRETGHRGHAALASWVDALVWDAVIAVLTQPELITNQLAAPVEEETHALGTLQERLAQQDAQCTNEEARWLDAYAAEIITLEELKARRADVATRRTAIQTQRAEAGQRIKQYAARHEIQTNVTTLCAQIYAKLTTATIEEKQHVLDALDVTVRLYPGRVLAITGRLCVHIATTDSRVDDHNVYKLDFRIPVRTPAQQLGLGFPDLPSPACAG
jgi:site-specific DNA recombinase